MLVLAGQTFREMLHKRVFVLVILLTLGFLALYGTGLYFAYKDLPLDAVYKNIMVTQLLTAGLYFASFINAFLVVVAAAGTIAGEIENGTLHSIVPKPIRRSDIVLGKFLGLAAMLAAYGAVIFSVIVLMNHILSGRTLLFLTPGAFSKGVLLFCLQPIVLLCVGMWGTTFLSSLSNGILLVMLYGIAMVGSIIEQIGTMMQKSAVVNLGIISSLVMPTEAVYRKMVGGLLDTGAVNFLVAGPFTGGNQPSIWMLVYTVLYMGLFLCLAIRRFNRRDI